MAPISRAAIEKRWKASTLWLDSQAVVELLDTQAFFELLKLPYVLADRVRSDGGARILRVLHTSRDLPSLLR